MFNKTRTAFIALLGLNSAVVAQPTATQTTAGRTPAAPTCTLPKIADTAPLEQLPGTDLVTVPVAINGTPKQFLLDIGLKRPTQISPESVAKLGLPEPAYAGQQAFRGRGGVISTPGYLDVRVYDTRSGLGSGSQHDRVGVGSLGIGNATGHHLQFTIANEGDIARSASYDGYLTGDFFRQYDVELDFAGKQVNWLTPTSCIDPDQVVFWAHSGVAVIPVSLAPDGRYQMQATVNGHVINAEIDTSSPHTVMRRDIADRYVGLTAGKDMAPLGNSKDGMGVQIYVSNFPQITFAGGGVTAENVPVLIQDYSMIPSIDRHFAVGHREPSERIPDLAIGMDVLHNLHMYVVPGQGRVYVTSAE